MPRTHSSRTPATCLLSVLIYSAGSLSILHAQAPPAGPPPPPPKIEKIKDNLYVIENEHATFDELRYWGGNITVYVTGNSVLLVDCKFDRAHEDLMAKLKTLSDKPVKYVVLTHNHADHAGGAEQMEALGATILISAEDRKNMVHAAGQKWFPTVTYIGQAQLFPGGKEVDLRQMRGHTRGDTVVYFPAERVVTVGDLLTTSDDIPNIVTYGDGGNWTDWEASINEVLKMDFDVAIPGHGPVVTKAQVVSYRDKMVAVRERTRVLVREKKSPEEIAQTLIKEFNWGKGPAAGAIPGMMQELR